MKFAKSVLFFAATAIALMFSWRPDVFAFTREGIAAGETWRLVSAHFVHFSKQHLLANIAALALILFMIPAVSRRQFFWLAVCTPFLLGASLYLARPDLAIYGGLSGWLSAVFIFVAMKHSRQGNGAGYFFRISIVVFLAKLVFEFFAGSSLFLDLGKGVVVEPAAHIIGAGLGLLGILLDPYCRRNAAKVIVRMRGPFHTQNTNKKAVPEGTA